MSVYEIAVIMQIKLIHNCINLIWMQIILTKLIQAVYPLFGSKVQTKIWFIASKAHCMAVQKNQGLYVYIAFCQLDTEVIISL